MQPCACDQVDSRLIQMSVQEAPAHRVGAFIQDTEKKQHMPIHACTHSCTNVCANVRTHFYTHVHAQAHSREARGVHRGLGKKRQIHVTLCICACMRLLAISQSRACLPVCWCVCAHCCAHVALCLCVCRAVWPLV